MYSALRQARVNDKFQDSLYLFLELVRAGVVHGHLWSGRSKSEFHRTPSLTVYVFLQPQWTSTAHFV